MIRVCSVNDTIVIYEIINDAARAYRGVIPEDRYHELYMPLEELQAEMRRMTFYGWEQEGS